MVDKPDEDQLCDCDRVIRGNASCGYTCECGQKWWWDLQEQKYTKLTPAQTTMKQEYTYKPKYSCECGEAIPYLQADVDSMFKCTCSKIYHFHHSFGGFVPYLAAENSLEEFDMPEEDEITKWERYAASWNSKNTDVTFLDLLKEAAFLIHKEGYERCPDWEKDIGNCDKEGCSACRCFRCIDALEAAIDEMQSEL